MGLVWFTGLPAAGKSTLARGLDEVLRARGFDTVVLDGDGLRALRGADLGFSRHDRHENLRRAGDLARGYVAEGKLVLAAFISPYREDRDELRARLPVGKFIEIHVDCPVAVCEARDPKGLYFQARSGLIGNFTGIDSTYEPPLAPELRLDTNRRNAADCVAELTMLLKQRGWLGTAPPDAGMREA